MSFYLVLNLVSAPEGYEKFRQYGVTQGLTIYSRSGEKLVTVWTASDAISSKIQLKVLHEADVEVVPTSSIFDTSVAIEKFMG